MQLVYMRHDSQTPTASAKSVCAAGFAGHFVLAQLLPQNLKDYDVLLAAQLQNVSASDAATAQMIATNTATDLLQNRSGYFPQLQHLKFLLYKGSQQNVQNLKHSATSEAARS